MDDWLRVSDRVLMVEMVVVGCVLGAVAFVFIQVPRPVWLPAAYLWGLTSGFIIYRILFASRSRVVRRTTERLSPSVTRKPSIWQADGYALAPDDTGDAAPGGAGDSEKLPGKPTRERPIVVGLEWDASIRRPVRDSTDREQDGAVAPGIEEDWDDIGATLFDVPGVTETRDALENLRVLTDEEYRVALSQTDALPSVDAERADRGGTAPTVAIDAVLRDPDEADTLDTRGESAPTLDEETWRRLRDPNGGLADEP